MERSALNQNTQSARTAKLPPKQEQSGVRDSEREAAVTALPALAAARAPVSQLNAASVQALTALAGNGAMARLLRRGEARAEGLSFPAGMPQTERSFDAAGAAARETDAAEGLSALSPLTDAAEG